MTNILYIRNRLEDDCFAASIKEHIVIYTLKNMNIENCSDKCELSNVKIINTEGTEEVVNQ
jgi:hypothetical protein